MPAHAPSSPPRLSRAEQRAGATRADLWPVFLEPRLSVPLPALPLDDLERLVADLFVD